MRKFCLVLSTLMCLSLFTIFDVSAANTEMIESKSESSPIEIGPNPGIESRSINSLSRKEIFDILDKKSYAFYEDKSQLTSEKRANANDIINSYNKLNNSNSGFIMQAAAYDENKAKLRSGNLIELTLDKYEGVSEANAIYCINLANDAKAISQQYTNYKGYDWSDAGRHFPWNYLMTQQKNKTIARTVGVNHEWGIVMIDPMIRHYDTRYNYYKSQGKTEQYSSLNALQDVVSRIPEYKGDAVSICKSSYSNFSNFWSVDSLMDFWNNCYGRSYAEKGYRDAKSAFEAAIAAGDLVKSTSSMTSTQKKNIWSWDWYSY